MAIRSLKTGQFSRSALVGNPVILPGSYESIATVTVASTSQASITFSSIPQTFTHLQLRGLDQQVYGSNDFGAAGIRWNGLTSNYTRHQLQGTGSTASSFGATGYTWGASGVTSLVGTRTQTFGANIVDILDYTNTNKYKTIRALGGGEGNGDGYVGLYTSVNITNTDAITSITVFGVNGNLAVGTTYALYGVN
jgi:hypothetical protein